MQRVIVSDTSCLIILEKLKKLSLLKTLFNRVIITQAVANEFGEALPDFIVIENPRDYNYQRILETILDEGEASVIALSIEKDNCLLIIDDYKARKAAKQLKLKFTGTLGLFVLAKEKGIINSVSEIVQEIKKTNFRISDKYFEEIIKQAGE